MWNIIIHIQYKNGGFKVIREQDTAVDLEDWENYFGDEYQFPDVKSATVINAFYIEEEK